MLFHWHKITLSCFAIVALSASSARSFATCLSALGLEDQWRALAEMALDHHQFSPTELIAIAQPNANLQISLTPAQSAMLAGFARLREVDHDYDFTAVVADILAKRDRDRSLVADAELQSRHYARADIEDYLEEATLGALLSTSGDLYYLLSEWNEHSFKVIRNGEHFVFTDSAEFGTLYRQFAGMLYESSPGTISVAYSNWDRTQLFTAELDFTSHRLKHHRRLVDTDFPNHNYLLKHFSKVHDEAGRELLALRYDVEGRARLGYLSKGQLHAIPETLWLFPLPNQLALIPPSATGQLQIFTIPAEGSPQLTQTIERGALPPTSAQLMAVIAMFNGEIWTAHLDRGATGDGPFTFRLLEPQEGETVERVRITLPSEVQKKVWSSSNSFSFNAQSASLQQGLHALVVIEPEERHLSGLSLFSPPRGHHHAYLLLNLNSASPVVKRLELPATIDSTLVGRWTTRRDGSPLLVVLARYQLFVLDPFEDQPILSSVDIPDRSWVASRVTLLEHANGERTVVLHGATTTTRVNIYGGHKP